MAGRGRGRGKTVSFNVEALGFGRGEALPATTLQPPPLFPVLEYKAVPLQQTEDWEYIFALKQEFCATIRKSAFFLKADERRKDIERYTDKYQLGQNEANDNWTPDWRQFPSELKPKKRKLRKALKPNIPAKVIKQEVDVAKKLESLEKKEGENPEGEEEEEDEEKEEKEEGVIDEEEILDEDDLEEETDYAMSYFDNGEGDEDDGDGDEGPVY